MNPTNAVGGSFIPNLHDKARQIPSPNPTNAVGGSFIPNLHEGGVLPFPKSPTRQCGDSSSPTYTKGAFFLFPQVPHGSVEIIHAQPTHGDGVLALPLLPRAGSGAFRNQGCA